MTDNSMRKARRRARKGAAWLDKNIPAWRIRVDPEALEMVWGDSCILGQLEGDYENAVEAYGHLVPRHYERYVTDHDPFVSTRREAAWVPFARLHGFYSESDEFEGEDPTYDELNRAWQEILEER